MKTITRCALLVMLLYATQVAAQSVTRSTFNQLTRIQAMTEAGQYAEAMTELEALVVKTEDTPYDFAIANQYIAHTSVLMGETERAREALRLALEVEELPPQLENDLNLFYGTVLLGEGEYEEARVVLERWYEAAASRHPSQLFSAAYANYMSGEVERAEELLLQAFEYPREVRDSWHQLHYQILFDLKRFDEAETVLRDLLARNPGDANFWRIFVNHHLQLEDSGKGLSAFMIAYDNGLIDRESDLRQIASLYSYVDVPEKAARLLEEWIDDGKIEDDVDTLKQLGALWLQSRERDRALVVLSKAAELAPDGRTFEMLGGIYFEDEEWQNAYDAYSSALEGGDLDDAPKVSLLAGICALRAGDDERAEEALRNAAETERYREQAESFLKQLGGS
jgi:tetratricopeptide (TPR) repeat protein